MTVKSKSDDIVANNLLKNVKRFMGLSSFLQYHSIDDSILLQAVILFQYDVIENDVTLFQELDLVNRFYLLLNGFVSIRRKEKVDHSYQDKEIMMITKGNVFGEWSSLIASKRTTTAVTIGQCHLFYLNKEDFISTIGKCLLNAHLHRKEFLIKTIPHFKMINQSITEDILKKNINPVFYKRNEIIYQENEKTGSLYLIYKGEGNVMRDLSKTFISVFPPETIESRSILKNCIINYKNFFNKELKVIEEKDAKEHLINIKDLTTILKLSSGDIGGIEVCAGIERMRYTLVASEDFTAVLVLNLEHLPEFHSEICKSLLPLCIIKEKLLEFAIQKIKNLSKPPQVKQSKKIFFRYSKTYLSNDKTLITSQGIKVNTDFEKNDAGFIKQTMRNTGLFIENEKKLLENKMNLHLSKSIRNYLKRMNTHQNKAKEVKMLQSNYKRSSFPNGVMSLSSSPCFSFINGKYKSALSMKDSLIEKLSFKLNTPQQKIIHSTKSRFCSNSTIDKKKYVCKETKNTDTNFALNKSQNNFLKSSQSYKHFFYLLNESVRKTLNAKMKPMLSFYTGSYDLPLASLCK